MTFDPAALLARPPMVVRETMTARRCILYALGVGADELAFTYERGLEPLPTLATVIGSAGFFWRDIGMGVDHEKVLHGDQSVILHRPIPVGEEIVAETRIEAIHDRGAAKGAAAVVVRDILDRAGDRLATVRAVHLLRGNGRFGGSESGMPRPHPVPAERAPDAEHSLPVPANLALIYRLSGDLNPLHIDPAAARAAGFERPVLHGLATYGIVGRSLMAALMDNRPQRLKRMDARFASPVYPGDTLVTRIWKDCEGRASFRTSSARQGRTVIDNGYIEYNCAGESTA